MPHKIQDAVRLQRPITWDRVGPPAIFGKLYQFYEYVSLRNCNVPNLPSFYTWPCLELRSTSDKLTSGLASMVIDYLTFGKDYPFLWCNNLVIWMCYVCYVSFCKLCVNTWNSRLETIKSQIKQCYIQVTKDKYCINWRRVSSISLVNVSIL